jgi:hypothetical protein
MVAPPETASEVQSVVLAKSHKPSTATEMKITTIGIDLAKNVFQVHGDDDHHLSLAGKNWGLRLNGRSGEQPRFNARNGEKF